MRECEKRIENLPFLSIDVSPIFAQEDGFRKGWKAALKWAKSMARDNMLHGANINIWDEIEEELKQ